jgi:hypothetical protein
MVKHAALILGLLWAAAGCTRSNGLRIPDSDAGCAGCQDAGAGADLAGVDLAGADLSGADLRQRDLGGERPDLLRVCTTNCGQCKTGACCPGGKGGCCAAGEFCDAAGKCRCGSGDACPANNPICSSGGPIIGGNQCGAICCGGTSPCPL